MDNMPVPCDKLDFICIATNEAYTPVLVVLLILFAMTLHAFFKARDEEERRDE